MLKHGKKEKVAQDAQLSVSLEAQLSVSLEAQLSVSLEAQLSVSPMLLAHLDAFLFNL